MDLSKDNQYIVTIGAETENQTVSLWDWTNEQETGPIVSMQIRAGLSQSNPMHWIKFNPDDPFEIATNSGKRLLFLSWSLGVSKFEYYSPSISKGDYNSKGSYNAAYTKTVFIPGTEMAVTGTESGDILVFDRSLIIEGIGEQNEKRIIKIVTLNQKQTPITQLMTYDEYLVVGNSDGTIRFYDFCFKVVAWFEDLNLSTIKSISFCKKAPVDARGETNQDQKSGSFKCSDFIVSDSSAMVVQLKSQIFEAIDSSKKKGTTLMHGLKSSISAIAVHPTRTLLAIAGGEGFIILWDYVKKGDPIVHQYEQYTRDASKPVDVTAGGKKGANEKEERELNKIFTTMEFTPDGTELLVGQRDGKIQVIDPTSGKYKKLTQPLKVSEEKSPAIKHLVVSEDGSYFATSDAHRGVCLFKKDFVIGQGDKEKEWIFNGKILSHEIEITGLCFGQSLDEND